MLYYSETNFIAFYFRIRFYKKDTCLLIGAIGIVSVC